MHGLILALVLPGTGIETTWNELPDGGYEYVVQLDDATIAALKQGHPITSAVPEGLSDVRSIRLQYGSTPLQKPALPEPQQSAFPESTYPNSTGSSAPGASTPGALTPPASSNPAATTTGSTTTPSATANSGWSPVLPRVPATSPQNNENPSPLSRDTLLSRDTIGSGFSGPATGATTNTNFGSATTPATNPGVNQANGGFTTTDQPEPHLLSPAEAFGRRQQGDNITHPDRRRPMSPTVVGGAQEPPIIANTGTFGASSQFGNNATTTDPGRYANQANTFPARPADTAPSLPPTGIRIPGIPFDNTNVASQTNTTYPPNGYSPQPANNGWHNQSLINNGQSLINNGQDLINNGQNVVNNWANTAPPLLPGASSNHATNNHAATLTPPGNPRYSNPHATQQQTPNTGGFDPRVADQSQVYPYTIPATQQPYNQLPPLRPGQTSGPQNMAAIDPAVTQAVLANQPKLSTDWWIADRQDLAATDAGTNRLVSSLNHSAGSNRDKREVATSKPSLAGTLANLQEEDDEVAASPSGNSSDSGVAALGMLFLSMGLNVYLAYLLRGFYFKTRQLARDLRETIATV